MSWKPWAKIECQAENVASCSALPAGELGDRQTAPAALAESNDRAAPTEIDDGRQAMHKFFVETKLISEADLEACWPTVSLNDPSPQIKDPFIQALAERGILPLEKSIKILCDKARLVICRWKIRR